MSSDPPRPQHSSPLGRYRAAVRNAIITATILGGVALGTGIFTFTYAKGASYLVDDPAACANCHIMRDQYDGWVAGSHKNVAGCNDCHTPPGFVAKYLSKMENGWAHSFAFTTGRFADPIQIRGHNLEIANQSCLNCHQKQFHETTPLYADANDLNCTHCHAGTGHGAGRRISPALSHFEIIEKFNSRKTDP